MEEVKDAVKKELEGPGRLLGYRAMHKKVRQEYNLHVTRDAGYNVMYNLDPEGSKEKEEKRQLLKVTFFPLFLCFDSTASLQAFWIKIVHDIIPEKKVTTVLQSFGDRRSAHRFPYNCLGLEHEDNFLNVNVFNSVTSPRVLSYRCIFQQGQCALTFNLTFGLKPQVGSTKIVTVYERSIFQVEWLIATLIKCLHLSQNKTFKKRKIHAFLTLLRTQKHYVILSNNVFQENITRKQFN